MNGPLTERLEEWLADVDGCNMSPVVERAFSLLREAKAALEELAAKQRIDEEQCDEMTAVAAEMTSRERGWMLRAKTAEARVATLTEALRRFQSVDERIREAQRYERRYGIHIGGDSALGAVFAWIDELCGKARDVLAETDEGA